MGHTVVFKLNKPANEFQAGESIGFNVRGGVQYYDRKTKAKAWTNYSGTVFAKAAGQIDYYRSTLIEGAIVELGGKQQKIDDYNGNLSIEFIDAWVGSINQSAPRDNQSQASGVVQSQGQQASQQYPVNQGVDDMDQSIPF